VKKTILALIIVMASVIPAGSTRYVAPLDSQDDVIALEKKALDGLAKGNPDALLALSDADISYFHVMTPGRLDGASAVRSLVEPYRGRPLFERYEMIQPRVQVAGDVAVLSYVLVQRNGDAAVRWNGTQVYQRKAGSWRIIHTHWSQTERGVGPQ
jgi:ketosteroid isomerase-like protein